MNGLTSEGSSVVLALLVVGASVVVVVVVLSFFLFFFFFLVVSSVFSVVASLSSSSCRDSEFLGGDPEGLEVNWCYARLGTRWCMGWRCQGDQLTLGASRGRGLGWRCPSGAPGRPWCPSPRSSACWRWGTAPPPAPCRTSGWPGRGCTCPDMLTRSLSSSRNQGGLRGNVTTGLIALEGPILWWAAPSYPTRRWTTCLISPESVWKEAAS